MHELYQVSLQSCSTGLLVWLHVRRPWTSCNCFMKFSRLLSIYDFLWIILFWRSSRTSQRKSIYLFFLFFIFLLLFLYDSAVASMFNSITVDLFATFSFGKLPRQYIFANCKHWACYNKVEEKNWFRRMWQLLLYSQVQFNSDNGKSFQHTMQNQTFINDEK